LVAVDMPVRPGPGEPIHTAQASGTP
jgi:hypothetical protein